MKTRKGSTWEKPRLWFRLLVATWTILFFLVLGSILNVTVAWGICLWGDPIKLIMQPPSNAEFVRISQYIGQERVYCLYTETPMYLMASGSWSHHSLYRESVFDVLIRGASASYDPEQQVRHGYIFNKYSIWFVAVGWPSRSMWFELVGTNFVKTKHGLVVKQLPAWKFGSSLVPRTLPLNIHFRGFFINTIFYTTTLWLLYSGHFLLRRRFRIRKGLCAQCGYVVNVNAGLPGASPNCTECGTPIPGIVRPKA